MYAEWSEAGSISDLAKETAVIAALSFWDYAFVANVPGSDAYKATGRCISVAAGRISYTYGFKGVLTNQCILDNTQLFWLFEHDRCSYPRSR